MYAYLKRTSSGGEGAPAKRFAPTHGAAGAAADEGKASLKVLTWNVNGVKATSNKEFGLDTYAEEVKRKQFDPARTGVVALLKKERPGECGRELASPAITAPAATHWHPAPWLWPDT